MSDKSWKKVSSSWVVILIVASVSFGAIILGTLYWMPPTPRIIEHKIPITQFLK